MTPGPATRRPHPLSQWHFWRPPPTVTAACRAFLGRASASQSVKRVHGFRARPWATEIPGGSGSDQIPESKACVSCPVCRLFRLCCHPLASAEQPPLCTFIIFILKRFILCSSQFSDNKDGNWLTQKIDSI